MTEPPQPAATALLLVNLGTPDAPTPRAVRRYLAEFLHDYRVVDMTRWLWCPLLHGVILPLRAGPVARKYAAVWLDGPDGGSPLAVYTRRVAQAVQARLPDIRVVDAMRYGRPALGDALRALRAEGVRDIVVLPLYPQYSTSTTASIADVVAKVDPAPRLVNDYHQDAGWIQAIASSVRTARAEDSSGVQRHLLFSFHGLPQRFVDRGDPYAQQCEASAQAIAAALELPRDAWTLAFQSRFGRERWLEPSTQATLQALAARGVHDVDVIAPGFAVDCLETLEEVAMQLAEEFAHRGGRLRYIPCLNDGDMHARVLAGIARDALAAG